MSARGEGGIPRGGRGESRGGRRDFRGGRGDFRGGQGDSRGQGDFRGGRGDYRGGGRGDSRGRGDFRGGQGGRPSQSVTVHKPQDGDFCQPSNIVHTTEDEILSNKELSLQNLNLNDVSLPRRPGYGTRGNQVILWANYFEMTLPPDLLLYRYSVEFPVKGDEKKPAGKKAKRCVQLLLDQHFSQQGKHLVSDFVSTIISAKKLQLAGGDREVFSVQYQDDGADEPRADARTYRIEVKSTDSPFDQLLLSDLLNYIKTAKGSAALVSKDPTIQALNIIVGHHLKLSSAVLSVGANKHYAIEKPHMERGYLGTGLEALRGFFLSVRAATSRILVNVQVKHVACYEAVGLDVLMEGMTDLKRLESFLKRLRVKVTHIIRRNKSGQEIPRMKTITGLASRSDGRGLDFPPIVPSFGAGANAVQFHIQAESTTTSGPSTAKGRQGATKGKRGAQRSGQPLFPRDDSATPTGPGQYITVADHFKNHYQTLAKPLLPVINVGTAQQPSYLPPEVCVIVTGTPYNSKLSPDHAANMIRFAVRRPNQNADSIVINGVRLITEGNQQMDAFGLALSKSLITVPGRVLSSPNVRYRGNTSASTRFGGWNMQDVQFRESSASSLVWTYVWLSVQGGMDAARKEHVKYLARFHSQLKTCGINVPVPLPGMPVDISGRGGPQDEEKIDAVFKQLTSKNNSLRLVLFILPKTDTAVYNRIKFSGDLQYGIHTICVVGSKFTKDTPDNNAQYLANVALKFNLKTGGVNQILDSGRLGIIDEGKTIVVGLDVTHPSPGSSSTAPSVAAIVASVDKHLGQWPADIRVQTGRQEMVQDLNAMFQSRLRKWRGGGLPENVLIFRDGACQQVYPATDTKKGLPRISIIIVGKRHHTRFYPTKVDDADRSGNPKNGTVVDRGVTEAANWDFFLQAHTAIQGTARPAHYYIILDEIFRKQKVKMPFKNPADMLEDLTHNMAYLFGRATKAVSICPPAYYADLACDRARRWLSGVFEMSTAGSSTDTDPGQAVTQSDVQVHERLRDSMFYI